MIQQVIAKPTSQIELNFLIKELNFCKINKEKQIMK